MFFVNANWPVVKYTNGTVGVKNDGGTVQVQSTDLVVDGNLKVSGNLFVQNRDLAEYEDRVSSLEASKTPAPPVCQPPGGDKLQFGGEKWTCVCVSEWWSGDSCETPPPWSMSQTIAPTTSFKNFLGNLESMMYFSASDGIYEVPSDVSSSLQMLSNTIATKIYSTSSTLRNDWNSRHVQGGFMVVADERKDSGTEVGEVRVLARQSSGQWTTVHTVSGSYRRNGGFIRVVQAEYGATASIHVNDNFRILAVSIRMGAEYSQSDRKVLVEMYLSTGDSSTWSLSQSIVVPNFALPWTSWPAQSQSYVKSIVISESLGTSGEIYMALGISTTDYQVLLYKNSDPSDPEVSEWKLQATWMYGNVSNSGIDSFPSILITPNHVIVGLYNVKSSAGSPTCAYIKIYSLMTLEIVQEIDPKPCSTYLKLAGNSRDLFIAGDYSNNVVHVYRSKLIEGEVRYVQEDSLKYENANAKVDSNIHFGYNVYVSQSDDIFVYAPRDSLLGQYDGSLLRYHGNPLPDQSKLSFGVSANFQGSSKDPPCPDEFPFWVSCTLPSGGQTSGWSGARSTHCNWSSQFRNWDEIEAVYNSYDSGDLLGCGGHQSGYPTSIKSYYESINILSVMKVQYDELVAGGLVPVATPLPPPNPMGT
ncbi:unnamed protein product [Bathycoccus prasinos]